MRNDETTMLESFIEDELSFFDEEEGNEDNQALVKRKGLDVSNIDFKAIKPKNIKTYLDGYVVGQEEAKKILSVAVYMAW